MTHPLVLFDGLCNLCDRTVQTILRWDRCGRFRFAPLQSSAGAAIAGTLKARYGRIPDTVILVHRGRIYLKSDAVLRIARLLGGRWYALLLLGVVPRRLRDALYDVVARKRYQWFGQREECRLPNPALKERFLTDDPVPPPSAPEYL